MVISLDSMLFSGEHTQGANKVMEEEYGLMGVEGEGEFTLYRDEVDMTDSLSGKRYFHGDLRGTGVS